MFLFLIAPDTKFIFLSHPTFILDTPYYAIIAVYLK